MNGLETLGGIRLGVLRLGFPVSRFRGEVGTTALRAKTFQLSQLHLKARALSQMAALGAAPSKRKWYKISTFEIVDLAEMFWVAVN